MDQVTIDVLLPKDALSFGELDAKKAAEEMRILYMLELVRKGKVTYGKAAELLDVSQAEFLEYMARHEMSPFRFTKEELHNKLESMHTEHMLDEG